MNWRKLFPRPHRHKWIGPYGKPVERISDIPEGSAFYRLDCSCGRQIDGAHLRRIAFGEGPEMARLPDGVIRRLGFKP